MKMEMLEAMNIIVRVMVAIGRLVGILFSLCAMKPYVETDANHEITESYLQESMLTMGERWK